MTYRLAHDWNFNHPAGTPVLAWPGTRDQEPIRTRTRSSAWVLGSGEVVVSVIGHAGGIALDHIELDTTRQPAVPDVEFQMPPCPICGDAVDSDGDSLRCLGCRASWSGDGRRGEWYEPEASRCPATRSWDNMDDEQCTLAEGHDTETHRPVDGLGEWTDDHQTAVIDGAGEPIR